MKILPIRISRAAMTASILAGLLILSGCPAANESTASAETESQSTSLLLTGGRVFSFSWGEPTQDGTPADDAPIENGHIVPDAEAVLIENGKIVWTGSSEDAEARREQADQVIELEGATVLPGLVDSHTHIQGLGAKLRRVDLVGVEDVQEVLSRLRSERSEAAAGEWIIGWGWDDGAWAANYPTSGPISTAFPDNPVALYSLHGFALWGQPGSLRCGWYRPQHPAPRRRRNRQGQCWRTHRNPAQPRNRSALGSDSTADRH